MEDENPSLIDAFDRFATGGIKEMSSSGLLFL